MQAWNQKCCHIKLWIIRVLSVSRAFNIICILFYYGLYTMAIDVATWIIIKKIVHLISSVTYFSLVASYCAIFWKLCRLSQNYSNFIYIYLKLGTEKHIHLKWVFLPQWALGRPGKNTHISMIVNSVTHLQTEKSYTNTAIANISGNSAWAPMLHRAPILTRQAPISHDVSQCFRSVSWCCT